MIRPQAVYFREAATSRLCATLWMAARRLHKSLLYKDVGLFGA